MNNPTPDTMDKFAQELRQLMLRLLEGGFATPIHFAIIGSNGNQMIGQYEPGQLGPLTPRFHHEHVPADGGGLRMPFHMFLVDSKGEIAHAGFERGEAPNLQFLN